MLGNSTHIVHIHIVLLHIVHIKYTANMRKFGQKLEKGFIFPFLMYIFPLFSFFYFLVSET